MADLDTFALLLNVDGHHFVAHGNEIDLLAIAAPTGPVSAIGGSLPHTISCREGNDKNLRSAVCQHREGNKPAVGRELSARLSAGVRDGQQAWFFLGIERDDAEFGISGRQIGAFGKQITAIGRPVRGAIGRGEFLKGERFACARRGTSNDAEHAIGHTKRDGKARTVGRPRGFTGDETVKCETGLLGSGRIKEPHVVGRVATGDQKALAIFGNPGAEINAWIIDKAEMFTGAIDPFEAGLCHSGTSLENQGVGALGSRKGGVPDAEVQYHVVNDRVWRAG